MIQGELCPKDELCLIYSFVIGNTNIINIIKPDY